MKTIWKLITIVLLVTLSISVSAQADTTLYKVKLHHYENWPKTGMIMTISGGFVAACGVAGVITGIALDSPSNSTTLTSLSAIGFGVGLGVLIPGIIKWTVGKDKLEEYNIRLEDARMGFYYTPEQRGITLAFKF